MRTSLTNYLSLGSMKYILKIKKKNRTRKIEIIFPKHNFFHLVKFSDIKKEISTKNIRKIKTSNIHKELFEISEEEYDLILSSYAYEKNWRRVELAGEIQNILESDYEISKFNPKKLSFRTVIKADYVLRFYHKFSDGERKQSYLFIKQDRDNSYYINMSIFADDRDYVGFEKPFSIVGADWSKIY